VETPSPRSRRLVAANVKFLWQEREGSHPPPSCSDNGPPRLRAEGGEAGTSPHRRPYRHPSLLESTRARSVRALDSFSYGSTSLKRCKIRIAPRAQYIATFALMHAFCVELSCSPVRSTVEPSLMLLQNTFLGLDPLSYICRQLHTASGVCKRLYELCQLLGAL
jgi:hypothetical protein